jgi:hypothetical protein
VYFFHYFFEISPAFWSNIKYWCFVFLTLQISLFHQECYVLILFHTIQHVLFDHVWSSRSFHNSHLWHFESIIKCVLLVHLWKIKHLEVSNVSSCPFNQLTILILSTSNVHHPTCHKSILSIQLFITSCDTCGFHKCHNWSQDFLMTKFFFKKEWGGKIKVYSIWTY